MCRVTLISVIFNHFKHEGATKMRNGQVLWHRGELAVVIEVFEDNTAIISKNGNFHYSVPLIELTQRPRC